MIINPASSDQVYRQKHSSTAKSDRSDTGKVNSSSDRAVESNPLQSFSVAESRKLLNDKIIAALEKTLSKTNQTSLYELNPDDFSPEKVANRILSFVGAAIAGAGDEEAQNEKLQVARKAIEKGFKEAKEILEGLSAFQGKVKENADKTFDLMQAGLDSFAEKIAQGLPLVESLGNTTSEMLVEKESLLKQSFDLELKTRDGDIVKVRIENLQASSESGYLSKSDDQTQVGYQLMTLSESGYAISVEGELDDDELKAIDKLLSEMTGVANQYFSGDVQSAIKQAGNMGYDSSEIASFSLQLHEVRQTRVTSAYQEVSAYNNERPSLENFDQIKNPLRDFAANVVQAHSDFLESDFFKNNDNSFKSMLDDIADINHLAKNNEDKTGFKQIISELLTKL